MKILFAKRLASLLFAIHLLFIVTVSALNAAPEQDYIAHLWISGNKQLSKYTIADSKHALTINTSNNINALALDNRHGLVWIVEGGELVSYNFAGLEESRVKLPFFVYDHDQQDDEHEREYEHEYSYDYDYEYDDEKLKDINLVIPPGNQGIWLSRNKKLIFLNHLGETQKTFEFHNEIESLNFIAEINQLWVVTENKVIAVDSNLKKIVNAISLPYDNEIESVTYEPVAKVIYLASEKSLYKYQPSTGLAKIRDYRGEVEEIAADGSGGLWIAREKTLLHADGAGIPYFVISPIEGYENEIEEIIADKTTNSVWVAGERQLVQVTTGGTINKNIPISMETESIALYRDEVPPQLQAMSPANESYTNQPSPEISLAASDSGIGYDPSSILIRLNNEPLASSCVEENQLIKCQLSQPLTEGGNELAISVADYEGNTSEPVTVALTIDTIPPQITINSPLNGFVTNQPPQIIAGGLSEKALLSINGTEVQADINNQFSYSVSLTEGNNPYLLTATDLAGNISELSYILYLDTVPPAEALLGQVVIGDVVDGVVSITGHAGAVEASSWVSITNSRTEEEVNLQAAGDGSFSAAIAASPDDELLIKVIDQAGNTSGNVAALVPSALKITILSPIDGATITNNQVNIEGEFKGPVNTGIVINGVHADVMPEGRFIVNALPLATGDNEITVTATTLSGQTSTATINVASDGVIKPFEFKPASTSGVAPFTTTFDFSWFGTETIQNIEVDYEGDGVVDISTVNVDETFQATYNTPGIYNVSMTITTTSNIYTGSSVLLVLNLESMEAMYKSIWNGMNDALVSGDLNVALNYMDEFGEEKYAPALEILLPHMDEI
ncbi:MAG: hypothetical protein PVJ63_01675, partial [Thioalkalispiraceae bacterium]